MFTEVMETDIFKALAHPTRVQLIAALIERGGRATIGELAETAQLEQSNASRQLKELRLANIISVEQQGKTRCCQLNIDMLIARLSAVTGYLQRIKEGQSCC